MTKWSLICWFWLVLTSSHWFELALSWSRMVQPGFHWHRLVLMTGSDQLWPVLTGLNWLSLAPTVSDQLWLVLSGSDFSPALSSSDWRWRWQFFTAPPWLVSVNTLTSRRPSAKPRFIPGTINETDYFPGCAPLGHESAPVELGDAVIRAVHISCVYISAGLFLQR